MGLRYTLYRTCHEWEKRTGVLKRRHPTDPALRRFISLAEWREDTPLFVIPEREKLTFKKKPDQNLKEKTNRMLNGEVLFFSSEWKNLGIDYDWVTNPDSGYRYDMNRHWSEIPDFSSETGDIKYVWEKSRFSYLLAFIRNDYHNDEDHSEFVFSEIESWINANPVNRGPNWRCSQEISLRVFNWCYALWFYKNSSALTEERWSKIQHVLYWSLHHVYRHINFSRIAVRNNHAITETLFLALSDLLFPFIPETKKWAMKGRKWFEEEIVYQIYDDGTFLQFSMNYHRVVIQLLSLAVSLTEKHSRPFSKVVYERAYKSLNFLYQCLQEENGFLPNYGANDGAWFFPLSGTDYRDFRPQLNTLHLILTGKPLYIQPEIMEEASWLGDTYNETKHTGFSPVEKLQGCIAFSVGGYYLIREEDTFTFIRCGKYKDRPGHADNLHLDIWYKGENLLCDAGSYKYNTDAQTIKYFSGTESHNTVMLGEYDQMKKGPRFIWLNWTQAIEATLSETEEVYEFTGKVKCFTYLDKNIIHQRTIIKTKSRPKWIVEDEIIHKPAHVMMRQLWHTNNNNIAFLSDGLIPKTNSGYTSVYYGKKEETEQIEFETDGSFLTTIIQLVK